MLNISQDIKLTSTPTGIIMEHGNNRYRINSRTMEAVNAFRRGVGVYVLTLNPALGYIGLDSYMPLEIDPINSVFLHGEQDIKDRFGDNWNEMDPEELARALLNYLY